MANCLLTWVQARKAEYATLTRHYYNLATDLYEYGWGACFHFCRFAYGEGFHQAIARHEHYLAHMMGMREGMRVLDVGCGVGGPAREMAKFTGAKIVGLNNNDYQIERATHYAAKEGLAEQLSFTKGDFMVSTVCNCYPGLTDEFSKCLFQKIRSTLSMLSKQQCMLRPSRASTPKSTECLNLAVSSEYTSGL